MRDRGKVQGLHFYMFLLCIFYVRDVTAYSDYLISFVNHLGLNLDISLWLFSFENYVRLFIVLIIKTVATQVE